MFIFIANAIFFGSRTRWQQLLGFTLASAGVLLVASHGEPMRILALDVNVGDAIMIGGGIAYAGYAIALRKKPAVDWRSLMTAMSFGALLASLPFLLIEVALGRVMYPDHIGLGVIAFTAVFPSLLAQAFFVKGVELHRLKSCGPLHKSCPSIRDTAFCADCRRIAASVSLDGFILGPRRNLVGGKICDAK